MARLRSPLAALAGLALLAPSASAAPPDPLRLVADPADLVVEVRQPRRVVGTFTALELVKHLLATDVAAQVFDSTGYRRFYQLVGHFERQLGAKWPELLDRVAGGGAALAVTIQPGEAPAVLVLQGTDEESVKKFTQLALEVLEQELARQEAKERPVKGSYRDLETVKIGEGLHVARAGAALVFGTTEKALRRSLDLHLDGGKATMAHSRELAAGRAQLPPGPLASAWLNMDRVRRLPPVKDAFTPTEPSAAGALSVGGLFNVLSRAPHVAAGLYRDKDNFLLTVRVPAGRDGMGPVEKTLLTPPDGQPGSRPFLEPKGVLFSYSQYLDLPRVWEMRDKLFAKDQLKQVEDFDRTANRFLPAGSLSKLLTRAGAYQRIVVVNQPRAAGYTTQPKQPIPAFAVVAELREPEAFARSVETIVRAAGLAATTQVRLKLVEEKHRDHQIVGYRFDEKAPLEGDTEDLRFNFSPCFARVGNQVAFCSTLELCRELIDLLEQEAKDREARRGPQTARARFYSSGAAELLKTFEDPLVAQLVLGQGISITEARKQVHPLIERVRGLGPLQIEQEYTAKEARLDIRLPLGK